MTSPDPGWELYRSFLAVVAEGSLSGAGRRLGLSQPTVGRHVEALEQALGGLVLFTRSPAGLTPTDAALELAKHVETMAAASEAAVRAVSAESGEARGVVRLTASEVVGAEVLPAMLTDFHEIHPGVVVELVLSNRTDDLLRREADIAVRMTPPTQAALLSKKLGTVRFHLYAHRKYVELHGLPQTAADALSRPLIGFDRRPSLSPETLKSLGAPTRETFALRCDSDLAGLAALRCGYGLGMCQTPLAAMDKDLLAVSALPLTFSLGMWLVMHEDLRGVRRMRLMFDHLAEGLTGYLKTAVD
jgi:DNA-binding transcriptional LysR family regulator